MVLAVHEKRTRSLWPAQQPLFSNRICCSGVSSKPKHYAKAPNPKHCPPEVPKSRPALTRSPKHHSPKAPNPYVIMVGTWMLCENGWGLGGRYHGWGVDTLRNDRLWETRLDCLSTKQERTHKNPKNTQYSTR